MYNIGSENHFVKGVYMDVIKRGYVEFYEEIKTKKQIAKLKGICKCGKEVIRYKAYILNNPKSCYCSCGCMHKNITNRGKYNGNWRGYGDISGQFWGSIYHSAKLRNIDFNITIEDAWELFLKQDRKCALTKLPLETRQTQKVQSLKGNASLDRIDSSKGYSLDNVQWLHKDVQKFKYKFSQDYFIQICKEITRWKKT